MKFSIITPTTQRDSLRRCVESVAVQTFQDFEHIIAIDSETLDPDLLEMCFYPKQKWLAMGKCYRNGGNTPRHRAWYHASGEWIYCLDDDNALASPTTLEAIANALEGIEEQWALFPIHRHGSIFYYDPPKPCFFDTGNAVVRRAIAQWPDIPDYASDAVWLTETLLKHPCRAYPHAKPIMVMPKTSCGEGGGINEQ